MKVYIAHAAWMPQRVATLERLLHQLASQRADVTVCRSETKEHASTWAVRMWKQAVDDGRSRAIFLNDDVEVSPDLIAAYESMPYDDAVSLHTQFPTVRYLAELGERYVTSYWLSGPGYALSRSFCQGVLRWIENTPKAMMSGWNEDGWANLHAWSQRIPILHPIPALVKHDVQVPSSLGYDNHPMRSPGIAWDDPMFYGHDLFSEAFWTPTGDPIFISCPWMQEPALRFWSAVREVKEDRCCFCGVNHGAVGPVRGGLTICMGCLRTQAQALNQAMGNSR